MSAAHAAARGFAGAAVAAALLVACGSGEDVLVTPIEIQRVPSLLTVHSGTAGHRAIVSVENHLQKPLSGRLVG